MTLKRFLLAAPFCVAGVAGLLYLAQLRGEIAPILPPDPASFPREVVREGGNLAALGDCIVCHTAPGGAPFAGGRALQTPFGTLYSSNITPDPETGIGHWSPEAFRRAMKEGVGRDGRHLYPAFPYDSFTRVSDRDLDALYAYLMTLPPVAAAAPENDLVPPLGFRPLLAGWKLLFLDETPFRPMPARDPAWNRGAYLVEGLGHCGDCHSPRNLAGATEVGEERYAGGSAEGWNAPPLTSENPNAGRWTVAALATYLRTGMDPDHSAAAGPMGPVVENLSRVPASDVHAIAVFVASLLGKEGAPIGAAKAVPVDRKAAVDANHPLGSALFEGACAGCHDTRAPMAAQGRPPLSDTSDLAAGDPRNVLMAVLEGIAPPAGGSGPYMPGFADSFDDAEIAALAAYLRERFTDRPAWNGLASAVAQARKESEQP